MALSSPDVRHLLKENIELRSMLRATKHERRVLEEQVMSLMLDVEKLCRTSSPNSA